MNIFLGMKPWDNLRGTRVIEPLDNDAYRYDLHNDAHVKAISINSASKLSELTFYFTGRPYAANSIDTLGSEEDFRLIFHNVTNLRISPEHFVPFQGKHAMDDFVYGFYPEKQKARIRWHGDTDSQEPDPEIEFWADKIEFKRG